MSDPVKTPTIEDVFDAEARLRKAAIAYASVESTPQSVECRRAHSRELRLIARQYAQLAGAFEDAIGEAFRARAEPAP